MSLCRGALLLSRRLCHYGEVSSETRILTNKMDSHSVGRTLTLKKKGPDIPVKLSIHQFFVKFIFAHECSDQQILKIKPL